MSTDLDAAKYAATVPLVQDTGAPGDGETGRAALRAVVAGADAHDVELGLGRGGPVVTAASEAVSSAAPGLLGVAVFDVTLSEDGTATADLVDTKDDRDGWSEVVPVIASSAAAKRVRLPEGVHRLRVRVRVEAAERMVDGSDVNALPSGSKNHVHAHQGTLVRTGRREDLPHVEMTHVGTMCSTAVGVDALFPYANGACSTPDRAAVPSRRMVAAREVSETRL